MSNEAVCRTAPATPGLSIILTFNYPASVAEAYMDEEEKEIIKLKH